VFSFGQKERLLSEYIRWDDYVSDDVILLDDGSVFMMLAVDSLPFETVDDAVINHRHTRLEFAIRDVAEPGLTLHFLQTRGVADASVYPRGRFRTEFSERLDARYRDKLFGARSMWLNKTYLGVQVQPELFANVAGKWLPAAWTQPEQDRVQARVDRVRRVVGVLGEELKELRPRVLGIVPRGRMLFSEIAEAVAFTLTGYWRAVPLTTSGPTAIFSEAFIVGHETFEVRMPHGSAWGACLGMHDFPYMTEPGMFDRFLSASYRHTVYHGFRCLSSTDGQALATRKQNKMKTAGDRALSQVDELTTAADLIASNRMLMGDYAFAMTIFADNRTNLTANVERAWGDLASGGVKVERETVSLEAALFSMVPGNFHLRTKEAAISSRNYAAFASMHNFPCGEPKGFWGEPIVILRTSGGTPFQFHLHVDGVGNAFVSGAVGSGKTTFLGFLVSQAERSGAQTILWDKDQGLEALVRALGGSYLSLTNVPGLGSGIAPLRRLTDCEEDLSFLSGLIRACIATPEPYNLTPEEDRRLGIGLRHVMKLPPSLRSLSEVRAFLGTSRDGAGARLEKWCHGAEFGWVIDCQRDIVELTNRVIAFDQSGLLDDPIAAGAVMATLFHYTGKLVDGRRLLFVLDEVWKALELEQFQAEIHNGLKTWRKYNSPIIFGTQDVADGLESPIGHTIRSQTPTKICFATPGAIWKDYGPNGLKFTETEFDIVQKLPKGTGQFLLKQGERSVVVQAPLGGLDEVRVISGTRRGIDALKLARERTGDASGMELVEAYHRALEELPA
jgi:type IV secretion system protein VirB4